MDKTQISRMKTGPSLRPSRLPPGRVPRVAVLRQRGLHRGGSRHAEEPLEGWELLESAKRMDARRGCGGGDICRRTRSRKKSFIGIALEFPNDSLWSSGKISPLFCLLGDPDVVLIYFQGIPRCLTQFSSACLGSLFLVVLFGGDPLPEESPRPFLSFLSWNGFWGLPIVWPMGGQYFSEPFFGESLVASPCWGDSL